LRARCRLPFTMNTLALPRSRRAVLCSVAQCFLWMQGLSLLHAAPQAAQESEEERVYEMAPGIVAPKVVHQVMPEYSGQGFRLDGTVLLRIVIDSKGAVKKARVVRGIAHDVDECAIKAVREWRFQPAAKDGKPVAVSIDIEIRFNDM